MARIYWIDGHKIVLPDKPSDLEGYIFGAQYLKEKPEPAQSKRETPWLFRESGNPADPPPIVWLFMPTLIIVLILITWATGNIHPYRGGG